MSDFKLPNGKVTTSAAVYAAAWRGLARPICLATGGTLHSFDPSISIYKPGTPGVWKIPTWAALELSAALAEKDALNTTGEMNVE